MNFRFMMLIPLTAFLTLRSSWAAGRAEGGVSFLCEDASVVIQMSSVVYTLIVCGVSPMYYAMKAMRCVGLDGTCNVFDVTFELAFAQKTTGQMPLVQLKGNDTCAIF